MKRAPSLLANWLADARGTAIVEVALVFPFMALIIFGTLETGNLIYQQHVITKGVQEAARYAARSPALIETAACPPANASWLAVADQAKNVATRGRVASTASYILPNFKTADVTVSVTCGSATGFVSSNPASGQIPVVVVSASVSASTLGFLGFVGLPSFTLTATHREMGIGL